ncbi:GNAT family protein [Microvirga sp. W0021]|uniref:GNAT family protein n=1 Tax=Hohaiivirga grylli TaxID=3133970 RepID=A0ABV0BK07_9HYPH
MRDLQTWTKRKSPETTTLVGRYVTLAPLSISRHADDIFEETLSADLWTYLPDQFPQTRNDFDDWFAALLERENFVFYAIVNNETMRPEGLFALMRTDAANGSTEVGCVVFGPKLSRSRKATEAIYLLMKYVFETLDYRRFEWKCDNQNEPSKAAALRFGFQYEGLFRQHLVVKGKNRDTAWFSIIDSEWPELKHIYEAWLEPSNFNSEGQQKKRLQEMHRS